MPPRVSPRGESPWNVQGGTRAKAPRAQILLSHASPCQSLSATCGAWPRRHTKEASSYQQHMAPPFPDDSKAKVRFGTPRGRYYSYDTHGSIQERGGWEFGGGKGEKE